MAIVKLARRENEFRKLPDLVSVGPATIKDLAEIGISSVHDLREQRAEDLFERLCAVTKVRHDPCVIDVFRAAIEQAKDPHLALQKCQWWYWSRVRKGRLSSGKRK